MHATLVFDAAQRSAPLSDSSEEDAVVDVVLAGVCAALEWLSHSHQPAVLRMPLNSAPSRAPSTSDPLERAAALVTGLWDPPLYRARRRRMHTLWEAAEAACGGVLWVAGYDVGARYPWGERCTALAGGALAPLPDGHVPRFGVVRNYRCGSKGEANL